MVNPSQDDSPSYWLSGGGAGIFPQLATLPSETEVVVIGGGLMGISTAYWLARFGVAVLLLESRWLSWGATGRNAGLMLAGASPLEDPGLVRRVLSEESIEADYATPGHLALASSEEVWAKICSEVANRKQASKPLYALDVGACEDLLKMRIARGFWGGRWFPQGGMIHSTRFVYGLAATAIRRGALVATQTRALEVRALRGQDRCLVRTTRGNVEARYVVYACNAWTSEMLPALRKVIKPVSGQVLSTEPLPPMFKIGLAVDWGTLYWRQACDGTILLGGCRTQERDTKMGEDETVNPRIQEGLDRFLPETFPEFPPFKVSQRWAGIMDCSNDGKPLVGPMPGKPNQWVVAGFNGHGMPVGLGVGREVSRGIATEAVPATLAPFNPGRFEELV